MNKSIDIKSSSGADYFFKGFELIRKKGVRRFVFIPLAINIVLFVIAFYYLLNQIDYLMVWIENTIPNWLSWISYLLWPLAVLSVLIIFSFIFTAVANWLAAPFNGLLSEKMELLLLKDRSKNSTTSYSQTVFADDSDMANILKDIPRTLSREWQKFAYYLPRAIGFFILLIILPVIGQILWFLFVAWMMAVQYKDYPFDNHKISFVEMKQVLKNNQKVSYSFGVAVAIFSLIPIINLIVMPVAICGATALWVEKYRDEAIRSKMSR
jgi:CysZ protein